MNDAETIARSIGLEVWDSRPVLVLIHAFPLDRRMWLKQAHELSEVATVVLIDLPGFGESPPAPPSLDAWADQLEATLDEMLGRSPVVIGGLSMGGYVALRMAERHPHRLDALILADTRAGADSADGRAARDAAISAVDRDGVAAVVDGLIPRLFSDGVDREVRASARELMLGQTPEGVQTALAAMRDRPDSTAVLSRLEIPTLVVVGAEDELTPPSEAEAMARQLPCSWLVKIPRAGHLANLEAPAAFAGAITGFVTGL
jgi:pimeloyl-ACP methyl ester carboxylesterase